MATYLDRALADGHATLDTSGPKSRITYVAVGRSEIFDDPEEKVRAEFWAELIYRYGYKPERIGVEVTVPDRTPKDAADLVVFSDDEPRRPGRSSSASATASATPSSRRRSSRPLATGPGRSCGRCTSAWSPA
jgi:hypothetical protein